MCVAKNMFQMGKMNRLRSPGFPSSFTRVAEGAGLSSFSAEVGKFAHPEIRNFQNEVPKVRKSCYSCGRFCSGRPRIRPLYTFCSHSVPNIGCVLVQQNQEMSEELFGSNSKAIVQACKYEHVGFALLKQAKKGIYTYICLYTIYVYITQNVHLYIICIHIYIYIYLCIL